MRPAPALLYIPLHACLCLALCSAHAQKFHKLSFDHQGNADRGADTFKLTGPDNAAHPELWEGPLTIAHGSAKCDADVSLVKNVYVDEAGSLIAAVTISGSSTYVYFVDTSTCAKHWDRIKAFTEGVSLAGDRMTILPACTPAGNDGVSQCAAAMVYKLSVRDAPTWLHADSDALTKKLVGTSFSGDRKVAHAKTKRAKLVE